jgi:histidinol-phosphatase
VDEYLALALEFADIADAISMQLFRTRQLDVQTKPDLTPVTAADKAIEQAIRDRLHQEHPDHGILGEEFGARVSGASPWRWVIDPIDGTKSYSRGNETWATLIALQHEKVTVVSVASLPALKQRYHACRGRGVFFNDRPIHVSAVADVREALLTHTGLPGFVRTNLAGRLTALAGRCWDARSVGNSLTHLFVARGSADIGWTSRANVWDFAALSLIVEEAGGRFTDRSGDDPRKGGTGISSNGVLHEQALEAAGFDDP